MTTCQGWPFLLPPPVYFFFLFTTDQPSSTTGAAGPSAGTFLSAFAARVAIFTTGRVLFLECAASVVSTAGSRGLPTPCFGAAAVRGVGAAIIGAAIRGTANSGAAISGAAIIGAAISGVAIISGATIRGVTSRGAAIIGAAISGVGARARSVVGCTRALFNGPAIECGAETAGATDTVDAMFATGALVGMEDVRLEENEFFDFVRLLWALT